MAAGMMMNSMGSNQGPPESSESESEDAVAKAAPPAPTPSAPATEAMPLTYGVPAPPPPGGNVGPVNDAELDSVITRSASLLKGLPRRWLSEILVRLDPAFDATLTANLSVLGLLACIYLVTRMRPNMQISVLRVLVAS